MRILFDTHALIWFLSDDRKLPESVRKLFSDPKNEFFFSSVSILEIAIKHSLKPELMRCKPEEVRTDAVASNLREIAFDSRSAERVGVLPWLHRDPFDRVLVAQAQIEGMKLLSHDDAVIGYGDCVLGF